MFQFDGLKTEIFQLGKKVAPEFFDAAIPMVEKLRESGRSAEYCAFPMLDLKIKHYWKR